MRWPTAWDRSTRLPESFCRWRNTNSWDRDLSPRSGSTFSARPRGRFFFVPFSDFYGNPEILHRLRDMLARRHFPHAVILAGATGSGKYTLALMLAKAMNCLEQPRIDGLPDFCGKCSNCTRIAQAQDLDARFAEAVEARENLRETDKKETRILIQTHPDVLVIPPDPPQLMIKVDQVRKV